MSGQTLTIGGGYNGQSGILPVPSNFGTSIYNTLQSYLNANITASIQGGTVNLENVDLSHADYSVTAVGATTYVETITNYASNTGAAVTTTGATGSVVVNPLATSLFVEDPAAVTVTGNDSVTLAVFGASSTVTYNEASAQGSVYAAGGANVLNLSSNGPISVYSAGADTINLNGPNTALDQVSVAASGTDTISMSESAQATVSATGSAAVRFTQNAGGNLDFINGSNASTVYSGAYGNGRIASNSITVFGGAGGGAYVGGLAGANSLTGGSGVVTLIGGGTGDILTATGDQTASGAFNELYTGQGLETLLGAAGSNNNVFNVGGVDFGIGNVTASGLVSTQGTNNFFDIGNTNGETLVGSTISGATNDYVVFGDATTGNSNFTIADFSTSGVNNAVFLENASETGPGDATISGEQNTGFGSNTGATVGLSDGTTIFFKGVTTSQLAINSTSTVPGQGITYITYI